MAYTTIDDPSAHFTITLWTGNATDDRAITNSANSGNFQPDWIWYKERDGTSEHRSFDSSRGASKRIEPNNTNAEATDTSNQKSFDSNGFTIGTSGSTNENGKTYVAWQWKVNGGTTASNSNGGVTSTVQANTTAGFSIVQWAGDGSDETVGHGLSSAPELYVVKNRDDATDWRVGQTVAGNIMTGANGYYMEWNDNKASTNPGSAVTWGSTPTAPTSTVFTVGSNNAHNGSGDDFVAYCFHSVKGYSKIGGYTGNGNADGTFVYTGFKPAYLMTKDTESTEQWQVKDTTRFPNNPNYFPIFPNLANVEGNNTNSTVDFLSNGFKIRNNDGSHNTNGNDYIYMAFAEKPFVSSEGTPTTAR